MSGSNCTETNSRAITLKKPAWVDEIYTGCMIFNLKHMLKRRARPRDITPREGLDPVPYSIFDI